MHQDVLVLHKSSGRDSTSGGVALFIAQSILSSHIDLDTNLQAVAARISLGKTVTVCNIYLPPSVPVRDAALYYLFQQLPRPFIVFDDFNGQNPLGEGSDHCDSSGRLFEEIFNNLNLCVLNDGPSTYCHPASSTKSMLDLSVADLADLNSNGLSRVLTLADDGLIYKTAGDIRTAVTAAQEQLEKVSHWCQETESEINPSKAQALWCTLNNKAVGQAMPAVSFNGEVTERTNSLRYLGIHFDRMLMYKTKVESTKLRCKNGLSTLKAMASKDIEQRHLFLLDQSVILSVIDFGLGLTILSQSNLLKLNTVQNEAMRVILGTIKDTPTEAMRYLLYLPSMEARHKVEQVKAYISMRCRFTRIHSKMLSKKKRGVDWQDASHGIPKQNSQSNMCLVSHSSSKLVTGKKRPVEFQPYNKTLLSENLDEYCREWPAGKAVQKYKCLSKPTESHKGPVWLEGHGQAGWKDCTRRQ